MLTMETQQHSPEAVAVYPESFPNVSENSIFVSHAFSYNCGNNCTHNLGSLRS